MKWIRTDKSVSCEKCGMSRELVKCSVQDEYTSLKPPNRSEVYEKIYCNKCLNKFEKDDNNYRIFE